MSTRDRILDAAAEVMTERGIAAKFVGGSTQMIGSVIASNINLNPPIAAAFSVVPIAFVVIYLISVQRTGALQRM